MNSSTPDPDLSCFGSLIQGPGKLPLWLSGALGVGAVTAKALFSLTQCTVTCGGGVQTRSVQCLRQGRPAAGCLPQQKPAVLRACNTNFCPVPVKRGKAQLEVLQQACGLEFYTQQRSPFLYTADLACSFKNVFFPDFQIYSNSLILTASLLHQVSPLKADLGVELPLEI